MMQQVWNTAFGAAVLVALGFLLLFVAANTAPYVYGRSFTAGVAVGLFIVLSWLIGRGSDL